MKLQISIKVQDGSKPFDLELDTEEHTAIVLSTKPVVNVGPQDIVSIDHVAAHQHRWNLRCGHSVMKRYSNHKQKRTRCPVCNVAPMNT